MEPAFFFCLQMNILGIPFLLFMNLDFLQIILRRIFMLRWISFHVFWYCKTDYRESILILNLFSFLYNLAQCITILCFLNFHRNTVEIQIIVPYYKFNIDIRELFLDVWCIFFIQVCGS